MSMPFRRILVIVGVTTVLIVAALLMRTSRERMVLNQRVKYSIETIEKDMSFHPRSKATQAADIKILAVLQNATAPSLRTPVIANAAFQKTNKLLVEWVSERPDIDGVALVDVSGKEVLHMHVPPFYVAENLNEAERGVLYHIVLDTLEDAEAKRSLSSQEWSSLRVVLVRRNLVVSNSAPIAPVIVSD